MTALKKHIKALLIAFLIFLFFYYIWRCPFKLILKIPCPGCGMTRAIMYALKLDFKSAFTYHPLWFAVPPCLIYFYFKNNLKLNNIEIAVLVIIIVVFIFVWCYRLMFCNILNYL